MPNARWLLYRLRNLWRRQARETELDAELQFHIETEAEERSLTACRSMTRVAQLGARSATSR
jgi:hypothetical protein